MGCKHVVHHIAKGISKRTVRMPWVDLRAREPRACLEGRRCGQIRGEKSGRVGGWGGRETYFPASLLAEVVPSCSGGT